MPRRSKQADPALIRQDLESLIRSFSVTLQSTDDLRDRVRALVPAHHHLRDLGSSLVSREDASSGMDRVLLYLRRYPFMVVSGDELMVIAGIGEWARRLRQLRVESGWPIVSGETAKEMAAEGELTLDGVDVSCMGTDDYLMLGTEQDQDAARRWELMNRIRRGGASVSNKILELLRGCVGQPVTGEVLRYVANNKTEWARRVRELRTDHGWPVVTKNTGRPDLNIGAYVLEQDRQSPPHDRDIPDAVMGEVLRRDGYRCQSRTCGWHHELWNPSDPRHLELHHITHHARGGDNTADNLTTLCTVCHDVIHSHQQEG